ncbi:hypothetical protein P615_09700 [Brevibacillus laterosporus PE36]|nr:hypothetical protein P615_09700 [Brevibacillus laterosporus PE36]
MMELGKGNLPKCARDTQAVHAGLTLNKRKTVICMSYPSCKWRAISPGCYSYYYLLWHFRESGEGGTVYVQLGQRLGISFVVAFFVLQLVKSFHYK